MTIGVLGRRYASALLALATESSKVDKIAADLKDLAATWDSSKELRSVFENPSISIEARRKVLRDVATASNMDPLLRDTLLLVSDRGRMNQLSHIVEAFQALAEARSGRVRAEVVTATELPAAYFEQLQKSLERVTGKTVTVAKRVDPSILGGVVARIGDHVFDGSLKNRLDELKHELSR
jgi:F-type H+-transporting ATPase subunit delta